MSFRPEPAGEVEKSHFAPNHQPPTVILTKEGSSRSASAIRRASHLLENVTPPTSVISTEVEKSLSGSWSRTSFSAEHSPCPACTSHAAQPGVLGTTLNVRHIPFLFL